MVSPLQQGRPFDGPTPSVLRGSNTATSAQPFDGPTPSVLRGSNTATSAQPSRKRICRVGQNRIYTPYMTVYFVFSLPKVPHIHRIYMVLANPRHLCALCSLTEHSFVHEKACTNYGHSHLERLQFALKSKKCIQLESLTCRLQLVNGCHGLCVARPRSPNSLAY